MSIVIGGCVIKLWSTCALIVGVPIGLSEEQDEDEVVLEPSTANWLLRLHSSNLFNLDCILNF